MSVTSVLLSPTATRAPLARSFSGEMPTVVVPSGGFAARAAAASRGVSVTAGTGATGSHLVRHLAWTPGERPSWLEGVHSIAYVVEATPERTATAREEVTGLALRTIAKVVGMPERAIGLGRRIRLRLGARKAAIKRATSRNPDGTLTMWIGEGKRAGATTVHEYAHALDMTLETESAGGIGRPGFIAVRECASMRYDPEDVLARVREKAKLGEEAVHDYAEGGWVNDVKAMRPIPIAISMISRSRQAS